MNLHQNNSFVNHTLLPLLCQKSVAILLVLVGLTVGNQTGSQKILKDENKHYGAVDESSSEQQFRKSYTITFVVSKICSHTPSVSGSYGRQSDRQSDKILVDLEIFKILY